MSRTARVAIQTGRVICAFLSVFWTISLFNAFVSAISHPDFFIAHWVRFVLAVLVVFVPVWGYRKLTEVASRAKVQEREQEPDGAASQDTESHTIALNTPAKRACFIIMLAGLCICGLTYVVFLLNHDYPAFSSVLFNRPHRYMPYKFFMWLGAVTAAAGLCGSLLYNIFVGKLLHWVRHGSSASP